MGDAPLVIGIKEEDITRFKADHRFIHAIAIDRAGEGGGPVLLDRSVSIVTVVGEGVIVFDLGRV